MSETGSMLLRWKPDLVAFRSLLLDSELVANNTIRESLRLSMARDGNLPVLITVAAGDAELMEVTRQLRDAAKSVKASESRFNDIADRIEQGLWIRSADGTQCLYLNRAFQEIWGRSLNEMNRVGWRETVHPDDRQRSHECFLKHREDGSDYTQQYRVVRPDGQVRWVENQGYSVHDDSGKLVRMAGIVRDVTRQLQIEQDLRLAQKLEGLGQLSAGIAHEINTPSQYVGDNLTFLQEGFQDLARVLAEFPALLKLAREAGAPVAERERLERLYGDADVSYLLDEIPSALGQSQAGMQQIKKIVQAMKRFSHPGDEKIPTDINDIISNTLVVARNEWKYVAEVETQFDPALPAVGCIPSAMNQVFLNIIVNAAHAIGDVVKDGQLGRITVSTQNIEGRVVVRIRDTGAGIPAAVKAKIFDPFFTTKSVGKGTGQGLAIVHKVICEDHKGDISVDSTVGEGTCFTLSLPVEATQTARVAA